MLEVGLREGIPFITFGNGVVLRQECRLVIETSRTVHVAGPSAQREPLDELMYLRVRAADVVEGELRIAFSVDDGDICCRLTVSAERQEWTSDSPWWISESYTTPFWP